MVTETVVKEALSKEMIAAGSNLTRRLDEAGFIVSASMWFFNVDSSSWRYIIASPQVDSSGIKDAYKKVQDTLATLSNSEESISLRDITLISPNDPLIKLLKIGMKTGNGVSGIRFSRSLINGVPIEDAYVYRLN